ncbi:polymerase [Arcobacter sp. F2176]|nr:polymerase [Arcobacter sp. F2176]
MGSFKLKNLDWFVIYIYIYLFTIPLHFANAQVPILSGILFIWAIIKFKKEFLLKLKSISTFLPILLLFLFFGYCYISILWSNPMAEGLKHINTFHKYYFLFIPVLLVSLNKDQTITAIKVLTISFGCYSVYSILIYLGFFNNNEYGFNPNNPTGHLRYLISTQYMIFGTFLSALFLYYSQSKKEKGLFILIGLLCFFALFINNSRTSQLSFFLILLIFSLLFLKRYIFNIKALVLIFLLLFSSIYFLYENNKLSRFENAYNELNYVINNQEYKGSLGVRLYFNKVGLDILKENLFFGTGPHDNRILLQEIEKNDPNYLGDGGNGRIINHFHSEQMDTLTAYGLIGYSLLFFSIIFLVYSLRKQPLYYYQSLAVFLSLFFNSFANKTLSVRPLNYVYIVFFLLFAIIAFKSNEEEKEKIENNG